MRTLIIHTIVILVLGCCTSCSYYNAQYYRHASSPWENEWQNLKRDWNMLTTNDSVWSLSEYPDATLYCDANGNCAYTYGNGQYLSGYGMPVTVSEYRYITPDGYVRVHIIRMLVDILWYCCVFLSLPVICIYLTNKILL